MCVPQTCIRLGLAGKNLVGNLVSAGISSSSLAVLLTCCMVFGANRVAIKFLMTSRLP